MNDFRDEKGRFGTRLEQIKNRLGVTVMNKHGTKAKVINYIDATHVLIEYENGFVQEITWNSFYVNKEFHSPFCKTVCGVGYFGEGIYEHSHPSKEMWTQVIHRVYSDKKIKKETHICRVFCL